MILALAQDKLAETLIVGKSTCGSGDTGNTVKAIAPAIATAMVSSVVPTGRLMNGEERLMQALLHAKAGSGEHCATVGGL